MVTNNRWWDGTAGQNSQFNSPSSRPDSLPISSALLDGDGNIISLNEACKELVELNDTAIGVVSGKLNYLAACRQITGVMDEEAATIRAGISTVLTGKEKTFSHEYSCQTQGGSRRFLLTATALSGVTDGVLVSHIDITEQKETEAALHTREDRARQLIALMPAAVYTCDADGRITYFNKRAEELWGRTPRVGDSDEKFCGSFRLYYADGSRLRHDQTPMAAALNTGKPFRDVEVVIERPDSSSVTVVVNIDPLFDDNGKLTGAINVFQDITDRKRLADENRKHQALLQRIIRDAPAGIAFLEGPEHRYTLANAVYMDLARGKGNLIGRTVAEVWPEISHLVIPLLDEVFHTEKPFKSTDMTFSVEREWGPETVYVTFTYTPMYGPDDEVEGILVLSLETTEQVLARKQVEQERALLEAVLAQMPSGVVLVEAPSGEIILSNNQVGDIWRRSDIPKDNIDDYKDFGHFHLDGRPYEPAEWPLSRSIADGEVIHSEELSIWRGDGTDGVISVSSAPIFNDEGEVTAGVAVFHDISQRKQAETERERLLSALEKERAQLKDLTATLESRVAERTAQVRDLASALALAEQRERARISQVLHDDLQQLLYSQLLRMELLRRELPDQGLSEVEELFAGMTEQLEQAVHVTRALTAELNPPKVKADDIQEALHWLAGHMEEAHSLKVSVSGEVSSRVSRDDTRDLLLQMIRELLFNVVKHANADQACINLSQENDYLVVRVEDDGAGFDVQTLTANRGELQGLGLVNISNRLELIGGHLEIQSAPGEGTSVTIKAPLD